MDSDKNNQLVNIVNMSGQPGQSNTVWNIQRHTHSTDTGRVTDTQGQCDGWTPHWRIDFFKQNKHERETRGQDLLSLNMLHVLPN